MLLCAMTTRSSWAQLNPTLAVDPNPDPAVIETFVKGEVAHLASNDTTTWGPARAKLNAEPARQNATTAFLDLYAKDLNDEAKALATDKDVRRRLNLAIIVAKVASKAQNSRLAPVTKTLLHDDSDAVVLWAMQAAKFVLPALITVDAAQAKKIGEDVAAAFKAHPSTAIVEEAYHALLLDPVPGSDRSDKFLGTVKKESLQAYVPIPLAFYDFRVKLYNSDLPPQPLADAWASSFFIKSSVWAAETPAQQSQVLSTMLELLKGAEKQFEVASTPELFDLMKRTGQAFLVAADPGHANNKNMLTPAKAIANMPNGTSTATISGNITALEAVLASPSAVSGQ